jgi:hypothetical protein
MGILIRSYDMNLALHCVVMLRCNGTGGVLRISEYVLEMLD